MFSHGKVLQIRNYFNYTAHAAVDRKLQDDRTQAIFYSAKEMIDANPNLTNAQFDMIVAGTVIFSRIVQEHYHGYQTQSLYTIGLAELCSRLNIKLDDIIYRKPPEAPHESVNEIITFIGNEVIANKELALNQTIPELFPRLETLLGKDYLSEYQEPRTNTLVMARSLSQT